MIRFAPWAIPLIVASGAARAGLENPTLPTSVQSGVGLISGFHCSANRIQVLIDDYPPLDAGVRTERNDTAGVCGRTDTGFSLLFNYNTLTKGWHRIIVFADGKPIEAGDFEVVHYGAEFLTGKKGQFVVRHFPELGITTLLRWEEEKQNFSIAEIDGSVTAAPYNGTYYGAMFEAANNGVCGIAHPGLPPPYFATFRVDISGGELNLSAQFVDGKTCTANGPVTSTFQGFGGAPAWIHNTGTSYARLSAYTCDDLRELAVAVDGERIFAWDGPGACTNRRFSASRR